MVKIRPENEQDYSAVYDVNFRAFKQDIEPKLVEAIRKSINYIPELSLVAEFDNRIVGHLLFSVMHIENMGMEIPVLSLAPLAVLPEYQNQGIGSALIKYGIKECLKSDFKLIILVGHPTYYPRFGFVPAKPHGLWAPFEVPDEAFMVMELESGALKTLNGMIKYPPEFGI